MLSLPCRARQAYINETVVTQAKNDEKPAETKEGEQPADSSVGDAKVEGPESQADNGAQSPRLYIYFER